MTYYSALFKVGKIQGHIFEKYKVQEKKKVDSRYNMPNKSEFWDQNCLGFHLCSLQF